MMPEGNLSDFMRHLNVAYTLSFNRRHNRSGHLYQGRYKSYLVNADKLFERSFPVHPFEPEKNQKIYRAENRSVNQDFE